MGGYGARKAPAAGVHDDLWMTGYLLESASSGLLYLVVFDLLGLANRDAAAVKAAILGKVGIPPERVMVASTQTHSGPDTLFDMEESGQIAQYVAGLSTKAAALAADLSDRLAPAAIGAGSVRVPGHCINRVDSNGPFDDTVGVVRIDTASGDPMGVLIDYACHPTVLGAENLLVSRDYCGCVCDTVAVGLGGRVVVGFAHGAAGNINPATRGGYAEAERMGSALGAGVMRVFGEITVSPEAPLGSVLARTTLPLRAIPDIGPERARNEWNAAVERYERLVAENAPRRDCDLAHVEFEYAREAYYIARDYGKLNSLEAELQAFVLGDCALVGFPGELFIETALAVRASSPFAHTFVSDITNGFVGYVPPRQYLRPGVYEARLARWSLLAEQAEDIVRTELISMLASLSHRLASRH